MDILKTPDAAPATAPHTLTITLRKPIKDPAGEIVETLDLREPTLGQMMQWTDLVGVERDIQAVATVSGRLPTTISQVGARDFFKAARFVHSFGLLAEQPEDSPATKTIGLNPPIEVEGGRYAALVLREPLANELIEWDKADGLSGDLKMVAAVSGVPEATLRHMRVSQFVEAAAYLSGFFAPSLPDGEAS